MDLKALDACEEALEGGIGFQILCHEVFTFDVAQP